MDAVGGKLDVGRCDEDVVDDEVIGGAVEVKGDEGGWVAGVAEAAFEGSVFDDVDDFDGDVVDEGLPPG